MQRLLKIFFLLILTSLLFSTCSFDKPSPTESTDDQTKTAPYSPTPIDGAIDQSLIVTFGWLAGSSAKFDVYFDKQNPPQNILVSNSSNVSCTTDTLEKNTTYYWKIKAKYNDGSTVDGPIWRFSTADSLVVPVDEGYTLFLDSLRTSLPCYVNTLFHVTDLYGNGITHLTVDSFEVLEDSEPLSLSESELQIKRYSAIPYTIKTVLILDNSTSLQNDIDKIRDAATAFINNLVPNQEVAVYMFSENIEMLTDFTSDKNILAAALQQYSLGEATTNLYGAVIKGTSRWEDIFSIDEIINGFMIVFTDGNDTQGSESLADAINAVHNKSVFTIGLGSEIQPEILSKIGTSGYYPILDIAQLTEKLNDIQSRISNEANSFYLLNYKSPKRGNYDHILTIRIKNNPHIGDNSFITGTFNSSNFASSKSSSF